MYSLLYGSSVNAYYNMNIVRSFIINDVLYMTLSLPLKHHRALIMSLYGLSHITCLQISHPYLLLSDDCFIG